MIFRKIYLEFAVRKRLLKEVSTLSPFMKQGAYTYDGANRMLIHNQAPPVLEDFFFQREYRGIMTIFIKLKRFVLRKKVVIKHSRTELTIFEGDLLLPVGSLNGYQDYKVFDTVNNKVMTIYPDQIYLNRVKHYAETFGVYFPMPEIYQINEEKYYLIERLISYHKHYLWTEEDYDHVLEKVLSFYETYFNSVRKTGYQTMRFCDKIINIPNLLIERELSFICKELLELPFPEIALHGDLWTANVLYEKAEGQIYFIDWEFSGEKPFFYDFFNLIWLEVYLKNNHYFIKKYLLGNYDTALERMFAIFGIKYDKEKKIAYILLYFIQFCHDRLRYFSAEDRNRYFRKFESMIESMQNLSGETMQHHPGKGCQKNCCPSCLRYEGD